MPVVNILMRTPLESEFEPFVTDHEAPVVFRENLLLVMPRLAAALLHLLPSAPAG
jgi:hypothetical protein